jgi:hypothetical protein
LSLVFFTDRDLGNIFPDILSEGGLTVERHRDHFSPDCQDEEWLRTVGERGWVAVTHDTRIRYKPNEFAAVVRYRVKLLVVIGKAQHADLARNFVNTSPKIERFLDRSRPPLIAKVHRPLAAALVRNPRATGTVSLWYPKRWR